MATWKNRFKWQSLILGDNLEGENFLQRLLESPSTPRKRGRDEEISDDDLRRQRNSMVSLLESHWPRVGYELCQVTKIDHIHDALLPLAFHHQVKIFLAPSKPDTSSLQVRETRIELEEMTRAVRVAGEEEQKCHVALTRIAAALQFSPGSNEEPAVENQYNITTHALQAARLKSVEVQEQGRILREILEEEEAGFSQTELLRFILDHRYSFTPLNFANAIAGVPEIGWRQSFKRCASMPCKIANTALPYLQVKIISACLRTKVTSKSLVERVRLFLQRKNKQDKNATASLKKHWYYLRRAIEQIEGEKHPPDAVPFRIIAEFERRMEGHTAVDAVLEGEEELW